jgi:multidrug efflux pump
LNLTSDDITIAIASQNAQVAADRIGAQPHPITLQISATVLVRVQLTSAEEFGSIVLCANPDGSSVRLADVARIEIGAESYNCSTRLNGQPSAAIGVQLSPTGNALATSNPVRAQREKPSRFFPADHEYAIPDTSPFVKVSLEKVIHTLLEAIALVFLVMFLLLQNFRYTIIPTLVVPVALLGTCAVMLATGFSINVLTMFAMLLAIGILVDDAIVVVENVERIMAEEGLSPKEAMRKAMKQITGAVGVIYQQFSLTLVVSILFSGLLALSLTPARCASFASGRYSSVSGKVRRLMTADASAGPDRGAAARARIFHAAIAVALQKGFGKVTLSLVVREAGLSKGGLLHHLATKNALIRGMLAFYADRTPQTPGSTTQTSALAIRWPWRC